MKTKAQKRLEAIRRLERSAYVISLRLSYARYTAERLRELAAKRHVEAARLRAAFKL